MWLRDSLPRDLPETRILVYGQDTRLHKSESFQNTKDLGIQLRNSISNIRSCLYVSQKPKALSLLMKSQESKHSQAPFTSRTFSGWDHHQTGFERLPSFQDRLE